METGSAVPNQVVCEMNIIQPRRRTWAARPITIFQQAHIER